MVFKDCVEYQEADYHQNFGPALESYRKDQAKLCLVSAFMMVSIYCLMIGYLDNKILLTAVHNYDPASAQHSFDGELEPAHISDEEHSAGVGKVQAAEHGYTSLPHVLIDVPCTIYCRIDVMQLVAAIHWQLKDLELTLKQCLVKSIGVGVMVEVKANLFKACRSMLVWIRVLYKFRMATPGEVVEQEDCCICLDTVADPVLTRCGHVYHWYFLDNLRHCIVLWYTSKNQHCPYCRQQL
jgi:hypothetical protein